MKTNLIILIFSLLCCSCNAQTDKKANIQDSISGTWRICVSFAHGLRQHPNHCPEIKFLGNGEGILENSEPASQFQWKIENDNIIFSFKTSRDKELFLSNDAVYTYELYQETGLTYLKLITKDTTRWYLLSK